MTQYALPALICEPFVSAAGTNLKPCTVLSEIFQKNTKLN